MLESHALHNLKRVFITLQAPNCLKKAQALRVVHIPEPDMHRPVGRQIDFLKTYALGVDLGHAADPAGRVNIPARK